MKKSIDKRQIFVVAMLVLLIPIAFWAHIRSDDSTSPFQPSWEGNNVFIEVCYPEGANISVYKCSDEECRGEKQVVFNVISDSSPTNVHIKLRTTGFYAVTDVREYRKFIVTRRSPDRYEYFGCSGK